MLDIDSDVEMTLCSSNIEYYKNLGYNIPLHKSKQGKIRVKRGTVIMVKIKDLPLGSHAVIYYKCDYCGKETPTPYKAYMKSKQDSYTNKDACNDCKIIKIKETNLAKYGVESNLERKEIREIQIQNQRHNYDFIKLEFEKLGYILLSDKYAKNTDSLEYLCKKHLSYGVQKTNYATIQRHNGACNVCKKEKIGKANRNNFEKVKNEYEELGFTLISSEDEYTECHLPLRCICKKHPEEYCNVSLVHARRGQGCNKCYKEKMEQYRGENHWSWRGGITAINEYFHNKITQWKKESMKNCKYKCVLSGDKFDKIHHLYSFNLILKESLHNTNMSLKRINEYTLEELLVIEQEIRKLHYKYPLGVCLRGDIHKLFHNLYSYGNNTPEQFYEFKQRYDNGEFKDILSEAS